MSYKYKQTALAKKRRIGTIEKLQKEIISSWDIMISDIKIAKELLTQNKNLGTVTQLKRLKTIQVQTQSGKFNIKRRTQHLPQFKGKFLTDKQWTNVRQFLAMHNRSEFYIIQKDLILDYNEAVKSGNKEKEEMKRKELEATYASFKSDWTKERFDL